MAWNRCFFVLFLPLCSFLQAQTSTFFVSFKDRSGSPYTIQQPEYFLSARAIERREKQGISLSQNDLPVSKIYVDSLRSMGFLVKGTSKWLNGVVVEADANFIFHLADLGFVQSVKRISGKSPVQTKKMIPDLTAREMLIPLLVDELYGVGFHQLAMTNGNLLHREGYSGAGIHIAVLDAGFPGIPYMQAFARMRQEGRLLGTWDFVHNEPDVTNENSAHGTVVLSCMAAEWEGKMIGTAPGASYWLFVTEDVESETLSEEYFWIMAAERADSLGVDIINSSLGYTTFDDSLQNHFYSDMDGNTTPITIGADIAASKGILVVNSAGNMGVDPWRYIVAPADGDSVLAVGAVNESGNFAFFSSYGPSYDQDIKPNISAQGWNAFVVWPWEDTGLANGTSFSAPIVSGLAATLWQAHPDQTNMSIFRALEQSAHQFLTPDSLLGHGIPDLYRAHQLLGGEDLYSEDGINVIALYPNPFSQELVVEWWTADQRSCILRFTDVAGRILLERVIALSPGNLHRIYLSNELDVLPTGVYTLSLQWNNGKENYKVIRN